MGIEQTLAERADRYGKFSTHATISQQLQSVLVSKPEWEKLNASQREALFMICHKIARILNGDPNYVDNWHDIAGYATLVEQEIKSA
jgi:hypothetical protein